MNYHNPILYADYSDPDVIRVGEDYYMVASSFTYLPGVPLLHSKDLVHWELINYCVRSLPFEKYDRPSHGSGTWAPSIRYHGGQFDDGRAYMVFALAASRCGAKNRLMLTEMDPECTHLIGTPKMIFNGEVMAPTIEGPKIYKRDGEYLILAPAGGVATGWQTALRAKSVWGPYEYRVVMHRGSTSVNGPHQGGWVTGPDGKDWFVHFQDVYELGRIIHLQPMCFNGGWPFIGSDLDGDGIGEPVDEWRLPAEGQPAYQIAQSDNFPDGRPGHQWQWQANPKARYFAGSRALNALRLACLTNEKRENLLWYAPNALTQIPQHSSLTAAVKVCLSDTGATGDMTSLGVIGHAYGYFGLQRTESGFRLALYHGEVAEKTFEGAAAETLEAAVDWPRDTVYLRLEIFPDKTYGFAWSADGKEYVPIGGRYPLRRGTWTGAKLCIWACSRENRESRGYGEFTHFCVSPAAENPSQNTAAKDISPESIGNI